MQFGIYSFGEVDPQVDDDAGARIRRLVDEIALADEVGLDVFGVGEHHRPDYPVSSPAVVLAAAATRTSRIRLTSAVSVLSSDDPVRVFQDFATLDLLSQGRAEIMAGRGSFVESFPLFGFELDDYDDLFAEKLELLLALRDDPRVVWSGRHRSPLTGQGVYPRPQQAPLPVWLAIGGTPQSAVRAGLLGLPLALAIIGGMPAQFRPLVELFRSAADESGHGGLALGINSHGLIGDSAEETRDRYFPAYAAAFSRIGRERGWPPVTRAGYDAQCGPQGALLVGSPDEVAAKILYEHELFGHDRVLLQFGAAGVAAEHVLRSIELFGTEVAPRVRQALARGAG